MAALSTIISGVGLVGGLISSNKAARATERQAQAEQKRAEIQNVRQQRQAIREARAAQASMTNIAAQTGGIGGSGVAGGISSVSSQLGSNLDYMGQIAQQNVAIGGAAQEAAQWQGYSTIFGTIGDNSKTISKIFGK